MGIRMDGLRQGHLDNFRRMLLLLALVTAPLAATTTVSILPEELQQFVQEQTSLPRYVEAGYSPLGRSPVVDAVLADPFYLPIYARDVSDRLKALAQPDSMVALYRAALTAGGLPVVPATALTPANPHTVPPEFTRAFGEDMGLELFSLWRNFLLIAKESEETLSVLAPSEKQWLMQNYEAFFLGKQGGKDYDFFTTASPMPLRFFELAARLDLAHLAHLAGRLVLIAQEIYQRREDYAELRFDDEFIWREDGRTLRICGRCHTTQSESSDFLLDLCGGNTYLNNAGGTEGLRPVALMVDLGGHNSYQGGHFVQGSGFLGIGLLADFAGHNTYKAKAYSQGAGFFGTGILINLGSHNQYEIDWCGQAFAAFGSALLWNEGGHSQFLAHDGMAQAASSTLGVSFLIDPTGSNSFEAGLSKKYDSGIGQGASAGVRHDPWPGHPSFYGGVAFLYSGGGQNQFRTSSYGQGSAYFLGAGILVDEGTHDSFKAELNSQGQGLHLAAGLLLKKGGDDHYAGGWGSIGSAGDRAVGMLIDTGGSDVYEGTDLSVGSARKPKALGVLIDLGDDDTYSFQRWSNANIQKPRSPTEWPTALFVDLGGRNRYSQGVDALQRGSNLIWGVEGHSAGVDRSEGDGELVDELFKLFPAKPRVDFGFDPIMGWSTNVAYRPLKVAANQEELRTQIQSLSGADYERRRQLYEAIDLLRFSKPSLVVDLSELLQNPQGLPEDLLNYALLSAIQGNNRTAVNAVSAALEQGRITSAYARKMALAYIGRFGSDKAAPVLAKVVRSDGSTENQAVAAYFLAKQGTPEALELLTEGLQSTSEAVRYMAALGLVDTKQPSALVLVQPLLRDDSFYVRRAAAMAAISLRDKQAIPVLLETLDIDTVDTGYNYGDNLYSFLAKRLGVDFGLDRKAWRDWWTQVHDHYEFPPA